MADVSSTLAAWSSTTASNNPQGSTTIGTGLDDNLRELQGVIVRGLSHKGADIASATTTDIGAVEGLFHDITGTNAITGLGTVRAGIWKILKFEGAASLVHHATSLILPGAKDITCADGDVGIFFSEGSGNWRCVNYSPTSVKSFTPTLSFGGGSTGLTYSIQLGRYQRFADVIHFYINISLSAKGSSTGDAAVAGLPFTALNVANVNVPVSCWGTDLAAGATTALEGLVITNTATLFPYQYAAGASTRLDHSDFADNSTIVFAGMYFV